MPCAYVVDKADSLVLTTGWDVLTLDEAMAHQDQLRADPAFSPEYSQLIDLTRVTSIPMDVEQVRQIGQRKVFGPGSFRAFVGSSLVAYGLLRMLQAFREAEGGEEQITVFHDIPSALRWLREVHSGKQGADTTSDQEQVPKPKFKPDPFARLTDQQWIDAMQYGRQVDDARDARLRKALKGDEEKADSSKT